MEKKERSTKKVKLVKKKKLLTIRSLSGDDWKIHPINSLLEREVASYLTQKGLYGQIGEITYKKDSILVYDCTPEFILSLRKNQLFDKHDYLIFHKKKGVNLPWVIKRF